MQAIRRRYNLTAEAYRVRFKSDSKRNDETFEEFGNRLKENFFRWVEIPQTTADLPEVKRCLNLIMIDQFLSMIADDTLRLKLRESSSQSVIELARKADELLLHRRSNTTCSTPRLGSSSDSSARRRANPTPKFGSTPRRGCLT